MAQVDWQGQSGRRLCHLDIDAKALNEHPACIGIQNHSELCVQPCTYGADSAYPTRAHLDRAAHRRLEFVPVGMANAPPAKGPQTQPGEAEPAAILATPEVSSRLGRGTRPVRSGLNHVTHRYPELDGYADSVTGTRGTRWAWTGRRRAWRACTTTTSADASASQEERGEHDSLRIPNGYGYTVRRFRAAPPRRP